LHFDKIPHR
jgi:hypothetical protein